LPKHVRPNDEAVPDRSFVHAGLKFCVPHSSKGVKINHEAREGKEFAPENGGTVCHTIVTWQLSRFSL
jgi:hypothetical protein